MSLNIESILAILWAFFYDGVLVDYYYANCWYYYADDIGLNEFIGVSTSLSYPVCCFFLYVF